MEGHNREKNPAVVRAVEAGKTWEERRENLLENLEKKLRLMEVFYSEVKRLKKTDDPEDVAKKMENENQRVLSASSPETLLKYSRLADLAVRLNTEKLNTAESTKLLNEFQELAQDEEARFTWIMAEMADNVTSKFFTTRHFEEHPKYIAPHVNQRLQPKKPLAVSDFILEFDALNVYALTEPGVISAILPAGGETIGLHIRRSPVSLIKRDKESRRTKRHESIHNLLEGASLPAAPRVQYLRMLLMSITNLEKTGKTPDILKIYSQQLKNLTPEKLIDGNQEEILSELENIEAEGYGESHQKQTFVTASNRFSTAGKYSQEIIELLNQFLSTEHSSNILPDVRLLRDGYRDKFTDTANLIRTLSDNTKTSGEKEALHLALALLPPSKYRHIERVMNQRFPRKSVTAESSEV
ncbi:MAG: hypothetical protein WC802_01890 [Patescibacteria group bacterium]